ncbi:cytochrome c oxidase subunit II [Halobacteriales archaeon QS_1_68_17]|nr:MAG: cytochrome c oxidase subunit II [Halobacteriales archaeon QS_1_68_17]
MNRTRGGAFLVCVVGLVAAVEPATAQVTAQVASETVTEGLIRGLNSNLLYVAIPIAVFVEGILIYTVWKYRNADEPQPTRENRRLEITWTVVTAIILLWVGVASYQVMGNPYVTPQPGEPVPGDREPVAVQVYAQQFNWEFRYPGENVTTTGTMVIPTDRPVRLNITSRDVLHAFHVPGLGLKKDAFPQQSNYIVTKANETGTHQLYCAEYCGSGHSQMLATVEVRTQEGYRAWLDEQSS